MALGMSQRQLAERARMTPDALSRALNGQRGFSSSELARIGQVIGADLHWLVTGMEDPHRVEIAARHDWDFATRRRTNSGRDADEPTLSLVAGAYRSAYPDGPPPTPPLVADPEVLRNHLGDDFVRTFADRAEERLRIDVVRLPGISTDYSLRIGGRGVVLLATSPRWYRSNWSLAHEIGHLALGHHDGNARSVQHEQPADRFAAELLLPESLVRGQNWRRVTPAALAQFVWRAGVSTSALQRRLTELGIDASPAAEASPGTTSLMRSEYQVIRDVSGATGDLDLVAAREQQSSGRRFPIGVVGALRDRVQAGAADPGVLAWALDVPIDEIEFPEPDESTAADRYAQMLHDRPSAADWEARIAMSGRAAQ
jgi:transcriptional regulator with XRE-family HTH domain